MNERECEKNENIDEMEIDGTQVSRGDDRSLAWCNRGEMMKYMNILLSIIRKNPKGINKFDLIKKSKLIEKQVVLATRCLLEDKKITRGFEKVKDTVVAVYFPV